MRFAAAFFLTVICITAVAQQAETELFVQTGHAEEITDLKVSPNGKYMATASADHSAIVWDIASGKQYLELVGHKSNVEAVAFSPDNRQLATGGEDDMVMIWDMATGERDTSFKAHYTRCTRLTYAKNGKYLVSSGLDAKPIVKVWDTKTWELVSKIELPVIMQIMHLLLSPDDKTVVAVQPFKQIVVIDVPSGKIKNQIKLEEKPSSNFVLSGDGKSIYFRQDKLVKMNLNNGQIEKEYPVDAVWDWLITPDGKELIKEGDDGCEVFSTATGEKIREMKVNDLRGLEGIYPHPGDDRLFFSVHGHQQIVLWNREIGAPLRVFEGITQKIHHLSFHPSKPILACATDIRKPMLIDLSKAELVDHYDDHKAFVRAISFRNGTDEVASAGVYSKLHMYDFSVLSEPTIVEAEDDYFMLKYSPDGKYLVAGRDDGIVEVIDAESGQKLHTMQGHTSTVLDIAFISGNRCVTTSMDFQVLIWNMETGEKEGVLKERHSGGGRLASIPEKDIVALTYGYLMEIYNASTKQRIKILNTGDFSRALYQAAMSPDGKYLAGAAFGGDLVIWNMDTWERRVVEHAHLNTVSALTFSNDGRKIITGGWDGRVHIWDVATLKRMGSLVVTTEDDFVLTTPENYYTATKGALKYVGFKVGSKLFPFEQFDLKFNRPDKVIEKFSYANPFLQRMYEMAYKKRLKRMGFTEDMLGSDFHLPQISIVDKAALPIAVKTAKYNLPIKALDDKYTLDKLYVLVNGVPVQENPDKIGSNAIDMEKQITLSEGKNTIEVSVINDKGVESITDRMEVVYTPDSSSGRTLYVFAFGVSKYNNPEWDLTYAAKDASDLADMFSKMRSKYFDEVKVFKYTDKEVSVEKVEEVKKVIEKARVDDHVVLYYSSHGLLSDQFDYYLATPSVNFDKPEENGLPYETFENLMASTPARNKLLLIDACHSGEIDKESVRFEPVADNSTDGQVKGVQSGVTSKGGGRTGLTNSFAYMKVLFTDLSKGSGATIISAAGGLEFAYESSKWNNGVFTYSILRGIEEKKMDLDRNYKVTVSELRRYVTRQVATLTRGKQTPTTRYENLVNDFVVY